MTKRIFPCPQCNKSLVYDTSNPYRPFCSERCQLIDTGKWASDEYGIPAEDQTNHNDEDQ